MIIIMILIDGFFDNFFIKSRGGAVRPITSPLETEPEIYIFSLVMISKG